MSGINYPQQGDLIWIDAEPHAGHEYGGHNANNIRRPMLVVSSTLYNSRSGMVVGFPITSKDLPLGFDFSLTINTSKIRGHAIVANILGYDFEARHGEVVDHVNTATLQEAMSAVKDIFNIL